MTRQVTSTGEFQRERERGNLAIAHWVFLNGDFSDKIGQDRHIKNMYNLERKSECTFASINRFENIKRMSLYVLRISSE